MIFAIYAMRSDPDWMIFDVDVGKPEVGERKDYDCVAVLYVDDGKAKWAGMDMHGHGLMLEVDDVKFTAHGLLNYEGEPEDAPEVDVLWPGDSDDFSGPG